MVRQKGLVQLYKDRLKKMDISAKPLDLFCALSYIGKVYGLTPHSSTDRCPFELIKQGPLPSLFPKLTLDMSKQGELTGIRHCSANLRTRKSFNEGEHVVVYDNHTKLSYPAIVSEVLGVNNYLVMSDNGPKHVSGDCMSRDRGQQPASAGAARAPGTPPTVDRLDDDSVIGDDVSSVMSDTSDDLDLVVGSPGSLRDNLFVLNPNNQNVAGQREVRNLGSQQVLPVRLRSQRI